MAEKDLNVQVDIIDSTAGGDTEDHDPHYEPIISLPEVATSTNEEDEIELIKLRAKLYRYDTSEDPPEWKERGTGDVKLLRHQIKNTVRVVMRRDKTLKICANHFVTPTMELKPNCGSDRAWVWSTVADYTTEEMRPELLAIRFANADNAKKWKDIFEEAKTIVATECELYKNVAEDSTEEDEEATNEENEEKAIGETLSSLKLNEAGEDNSAKAEIKVQEKDLNKKSTPTEESPEK